jgi:4-carboxymuconolactone decarboxylase
VASRDLAIDGRMMSANRGNDVKKYRVPLVEIPQDLIPKLVALHGEPRDFDRALANHPGTLETITDLTIAFRSRCNVPPRLREILILRIAQIERSSFEWTQHEQRAAVAGVMTEQIDQLAAWPISEAFSEAERTALAYVEAICHGSVSVELDAAVSSSFSPFMKVDIASLTSFYCMIARLLEALGVS